MSVALAVCPQVVDSSLKAIDDLDFDMVKMKLCLPIERDGEGWTQEEANKAEQLYRIYLKLTAMFPETTLVPTKTIDTFWHQHVLDTRKYAKDCDNIFGEFLHHYPYLGLENEEDMENLLGIFEETAQLYMEHFGVDIAIEKKGSCKGRCCSGCGN